MVISSMIVMTVVGAAAVLFVLRRDGGDEPVVVTPITVAASTSPAGQETDATVKVTQPEMDFVREAYKLGYEEDEGDDLGVLNHGRSFCSIGTRGEDGQIGPVEDWEDPPPTLASMIEDRPDETQQLAVKYLCSRHKSALAKALAGFNDGDYGVRAKPDRSRFYRFIQPGTYKTLGKATNCYWERTTKGGGTLANDFVTNAPGGVTVTILPTDGGFTSKRCGGWVRK